MPPAASTPIAEMVEALHSLFALCNEVLAVVSREHEALRAPGGFSALEFHRQREALLPKLDNSLHLLSHYRMAWQQAPSAVRAPHPEVSALLQANQDLIMKIIVLNRENEQALLRRGVAPARPLPPAPGQSPHFVAQLYQRHTN